MSIVKMNKVTIIGMKDKEEQALKQIMKKGFVQIDDSSSLVDDDEFKNVLNKQDSNEEIVTINQKISVVDTAIKAIYEFNNLKKKMFAQKKEFTEITSKVADKNFTEAKLITKKAQDLRNMQNEIQEKEILLNDLLPWENFEISNDIEKVKYLEVITGTFNSSFKEKKLDSELKNEHIKYTIHIANKDKKKVYVMFAIEKKNAKTMRQIIKKNGFVENAILKNKKNIKEQIEDVKKSIKKLNETSEQILGVISESKLEMLENLYDYYQIQKQIKSIKKNIVTTNNTFYLEGWIPANCKLESGKDFIVKQREANSGEEQPILLKNNRLVTPFESITKMYSVPNSNEIDPNPIMAIFYIIFFGLMLSDLGYGALLTIAFAFVWFKSKYSKGEGSLVKLLTYCGISSMAWGVFFGSCFGGLIKLPAIMDPLTDVMPLMGLALALGILHMYVGMFIKAIELIKERKIIDAICDVFFWYLFLTGVFALVLPIVAGDIGIYSVIGKYIAIIGAVGIFLTNGRKEKNIISKIIKGFSGLYGITSYFSDVLSYSRLMALCLSTAVIAQVVNLLAGLVGPIPAVIIGIIGHGFNLANSALGSYVHTSRLQYVEFFGKFYEGGGKEFTPFKYNNKYTKIKEEF